MLHAIELLPDEAGADVVRRDWRALRAAGLPSQLDHRGVSNAPHLTVVAAPATGPEVEAVAVELLGPLLPQTARAAGLVVLGGSRVTLARVLDVEDEVVAAVLAVRRATASPQHAGWLPHVTLARRLDRADVQRAVDVLGHDDVELRFTELRRWDPDLRETRTLGCHGKWSS